MEFLLELDRQVFLLMNQLPYVNELKFVTPFLDCLMVFLSSIGSGALVWLVLGTMIARFKKKRDLKAIIDFLWPLFLSLALSGIFASLILKPLVGRLRPNFVILKTRVLGRVLDDFSFPSGHATSSFAAAYVLSQKKKAWRLWFYLLAVLISFSRVYLGVHYPSDVLVGAVLGLVIGKVSLVIDKKAIKERI